MGFNKVTHLTPADNLQSWLDNPQDSDCLALQPGVYKGNFKLKKYTKPLTICTDTVLPDKRISPSDSSWMAKFQVANSLNPELTNEDGISNYTLSGLEFLPNVPNPDRDLVVLGRIDATDYSQVPTNITFDKCYWHGDDVKGCHRGLEFNVRTGKITRCYFEKILESGRQCQAIGIIFGGPYYIGDNYLEASGENILFGGADPKIPNALPHDVIFENNHCFKRPEWRAIHGTVANLFEIKFGINYLVQNNIFENCWSDIQAGHGVVITVRNQNGGAPWAVIQNVQFLNNIVKGVSGYGINTLGFDDLHPSQRCSELLIRNNWVNAHGGIQVLDGFNQMSVVNNTIEQTSSFLAFSGKPLADFKCYNNVAYSGLYGVSGNNTSVGKPTLDAFCTAPYEFDFNVIQKSAARPIPYPPNNYLLAVGALPPLLVNGVYQGPERGANGELLGYRG